MKTGFVRIFAALAMIFSFCDLASAQSEMELTYFLSDLTEFHAGQYANTYVGDAPVQAGVKLVLGVQGGMYDSEIYYTSDKTDPDNTSTKYDEANSIELTAAMAVDNQITIKAKAYSSGKESSIWTFVIELAKIDSAKIAFSHEPGQWPLNTVVTLSTLGADSIFVATGETEATAVDFEKTVGKTVDITITEAMVVRAYAMKDGEASDTVSAGYTLFTKPDAPILSPGSGSYSEFVFVGVSATMADSLMVATGATKEAATDFQNQGMLFADIMVSTTTVVRAYAMKHGISSDTVEGIYAFKPAVPAFTPLSGSTLDLPLRPVVTLASEEEGVEIFYTGDRTQTFVKYTGAIAVSQDTSFWAYAIKDGISSDTVKASYVTDNADARIDFSNVGRYSLPADWLFKKDKPTEVSGNASFECGLDADGLWKLSCMTINMEENPKVEADRTIWAVTPVYQVKDGYTDPYAMVRVKVGCGSGLTDGSYTLKSGDSVSFYLGASQDAAEWTHVATKAADLADYSDVKIPLSAVDGEFCIKIEWHHAYASFLLDQFYPTLYVKNVRFYGAELAATQPLHVFADPMGGRVEPGTIVDFYANEGATVYYMPDTATTFSKYEQYSVEQNAAGTILTIDESMKFKVYARRGSENTDTLELAYAIKTADPVFNPQAGGVLANTEVTVAKGDADTLFVAIGQQEVFGKYTADVKVVVTKDTVISAYVKKGDLYSDTVVAEYYIKSAAPVFTPAPGVVRPDTEVTIAKGDADSIFVAAGNAGFVKYAADVKFVVSEDTLVRAYAMKDGRRSDVVEGEYGVIYNPVFNPGEGELAEVTEVKVTSRNATMMRYATGKTAAEAKEFKYYVIGSEFTVKVSSDTVIRVYAVRGIYSDTVTATYTFNPAATVAAPTFSLSGEVKAGDTLRIDCATEGAEIFYAMDTAAFVAYTDGIVITKSVKVRAYAKKGNVVSDTTEVSLTVAVSLEGRELAGVSVYPNPGNGRFNVSVPVDGTLEVFCGDGRLVMRRLVVCGEMSVEIGQSGVYFVRVRATNGQVAVRKVVVR